MPKKRQLENVNRFQMAEIILQIVKPKIRGYKKYWLTLKLTFIQNPLSHFRDF